MNFGQIWTLCDQQLIQTPNKKFNLFTVNWNDMDISIISSISFGRFLIQGMIPYRSSNSVSAAETSWHHDYANQFLNPYEKQSEDLHDTYSGSWQ